MTTHRLLNISVLALCVLLSASVACGKANEPPRRETEVTPGNTDNYGGTDVGMKEENSESGTSDDEPEVDVAEDNKGEVSADEVRKEALEALETARAFARQHRHEYQGRIGEKLNRLQLQIEKLKAEAQKKKAESKDELDHAISEVDEKLKDVRGMLEDMKSESEEAWRDLEPKIDKSVEELERFVKDLIPSTE